MQKSHKLGLFLAATLAYQLFVNAAVYWPMRYFDALPYWLAMLLCCIILPFALAFVLALIFNWWIQRLSRGPVPEPERYLFYSVFVLPALVLMGLNFWFNLGVYTDKDDLNLLRLEVYENLHPEALAQNPERYAQAAYISLAQALNLRSDWADRDSFISHSSTNKERTRSSSTAYFQVYPILEGQERAVLLWAVDQEAKPNPQLKTGNRPIAGRLHNRNFSRANYLKAVEKVQAKQGLSCTNPPIFIELSEEPWPEMRAGAASRIARLFLVLNLLFGLSQLIWWRIGWRLF